MPRRTARQQLLLTHAPKYDRTGLHASDCPCPRCEAGYRPSNAERYQAEQARRRCEWARAQAEEGQEPGRKEKAAATAAFRAAAREEETRLRLEEEKRIAATRKVPTAEEFARLRAEHGFPPPRGRR
jgi:hypothetical protein